MKTKIRILESALTLFNRLGWVNVTLRDVSAALNISYGNVTYHYPNKEKLLETIYAAYQEGLMEINRSLAEHPDKFLQMLAAPSATFQLSLKYRFLFVDFLELQRQYPAFMAEVLQSHQQRKQWWKRQLEELKHSGILRPDISDYNLEFMMEMSGMVRTFFFLQPALDEADLAKLQFAYISQVNAVLWPYLSEYGLQLARKAGFFTD